MAETLGLVVGLAAFSGTILRVGYEYVAKVKNAPKEVRLLLMEVASLELVLSNLEDLTGDIDSTSGIERTLQALSKSGTFEFCREVLKQAETAIRACGMQEGSGKDAKNFGRRLLWPFKESETRELMLKLKNLREAFNAALGVDSAFALRRIEASQETIESGIVQLSASIDSQHNSYLRDKLSKWLYPADLASDQCLESARLSRFGQTGEWFLHSKAFRNWINTNRSLLWLNGIPGCGKTVLLSTTIDQLKSGSYLNEDDVVTFFYCDHKDLKTQGLQHFLATLVSQMFRSSDKCIRDAQLLFDSKKQAKEDKIRTDDYLNLIQAMCNHFSRIFVIVDALDENPNAPSIMDHLNRLMTDGRHGSKFRTLVGTRSSSQMERLLSRQATCTVTLHENSRSDIQGYVNSEVLRRMATRSERVRQLQDKIIEKITAQADGLFLQAKLQIDYVCNLKTPKAMRNALDNMPSGLEPMYDRMLLSIMSENSENLLIIKNVLRWVLGAVAPLNLDALAHAISLRLEDTEIDDDNVADDLEEVCGSFVCLDQNSTGTQFIRPAHKSVVEYFGSDYVRASEFSSFYRNSTEVDLQLGLICIKYLSLEELDGLLTSATVSPTWEAFYRRYPLYDYAARNWHVHLQRSKLSKEDFDDLVLPHLGWFLDPRKAVHRYQLWQKAIAQPAEIARTMEKDKSSITESTADFVDPIFFTIEYGLTFAFDWIFAKSRPSPNQILFNGDTFLTRAVAAGHINMVDRLLELGAEPNIRAKRHTRNGMTPLHFAAEIGSLEISTLLLRHGAEVDFPSASGATPFYRAVRSGSVPLMTMFKDNGANINVQTWDHWTPIFEAVWLNRLDIIKLLLQWQADANVPTLFDQTPLYVAEKRGQTEIADLLKQQIPPSERYITADPAPEQDTSHDAHVSTMNQQGTKFIEKTKIWSCCCCDSVYTYPSLDVRISCAECDHKKCTFCKVRFIQVFGELS